MCTHACICTRSTAHIRLLVPAVETRDIVAGSREANALAAEHGVTASALNSVLANKGEAGGGSQGEGAKAAGAEGEGVGKKGKQGGVEDAAAARSGGTPSTSAPGERCLCLIASTVRFVALIGPCL